MDNNEMNNQINPISDMPQEPVDNAMEMTQELVTPEQPQMDMMNQQMAPGQPQMDMMGQQMAPGQPQMDMMGQQMAPGQPQMDMMGQQMAPGQPQMDMMGQQMAPAMGMQQGMMAGMQPGMMPQQPMTPNGKKPKVKKPLTKGQKTGIIIGSIAAVAAIVCGVIFIPKFFKSDREKVLDAYEATFDSYAENNSTLSQKIDAEAIQKAYLENGGESDVNVSFEIGDETYSLSYNQNVTTIVDQKNKQASGSVNIGLGDATLLETSLYADTDHTYLELPELIDGYITFPNKDVANAIFNSPWAESLGVKEGIAMIPSYDLNYFTGDNAMESNEIYSGYVSALEQVWDKAEFKKQGKAKIDVNGQTVTAKEYYITLKKDDIVSAVNSALDGVTEAVASNGEMLDEMDMDISDFEYGMNQVKTLLPSFINKDFVIKVYIKDKKVIKTVCKDDINLMGAKLGYDFWMDTAENDVIVNMGFSAMDETAGLKYEAHDLKGNTNGKIGVYAGSENYDITFNKTKTTSGTVETTVYNIKAVDMVTADITYNYDSSNDTFNGSIDANVVGDATAQITFKGKMENLQKGVSYAMNLEEMKFKVMNQDMLTMTAYAGLDTSKTTAQVIDDGKKKYDLSLMAEADFESMITDNQSNIEAWLNRIENEPVFQDLAAILGAGDFDDDDVIYDDEDLDIDIEDLPAETLENVSLSAGGVVYRVLGSLEGFEYFGTFEGAIELDTKNSSSIIYDLVEADSIDAALEDKFISVAESDDTEVSESAYSQDTEIDGVAVKYSAESYIFYDMNITGVTAVTEVEPGIFMTMTAYIYTDDDSYTVEDILQAISPQYYEAEK